MRRALLGLIPVVLLSALILTTLTTDAGASVLAVPLLSPHETEATPASLDQALNVEYVGQYGGWVSDVSRLGDFTFIGEGPRLAILDLSDPAAPVVIGKTEYLGSSVSALAVSGSYAYLAVGGRGLIVVNVSDPTSPYAVGAYDTPGSAADVVLQGTLAYVADGSGGLRIIDVSIPGTPNEIGTHDTPGKAYRVTMSEDYVYIADGSGGLRIVDVSDPASPHEAGFFDTPGDIRDVAVDGSYAYLTDLENGLRIVDVGDPAEPVEVGYYRPNSGPYELQVAAPYVYIAITFRGLLVINVADPTAPALVREYRVTQDCFTTSVALDGPLAYIGDMSVGLVVLDVTDPAEPTEVGRYSSLQYASGVAVAGAYTYIADEYFGLRIVDAANPTMLVETGLLEIPGFVRDVALAGTGAYVADTSIGLRVLNVANPAIPTEVGRLAIGSWADDVAVVGSYAYVAASSSGLHIVSVVDPTAPVEVGTFDTPGQATGVAVDATYAYIADGSAGVRIVSVVDPASPREVGHYDTPGTATGIALAGSYAYIADGTGGLRIVDVANPASPLEVGFHDTPGDASSVAIHGSYAYVADDLVDGVTIGGLRVVSVTDPTAPVEVGHFITPQGAKDVVVVDGLVYVADGAGGLILLRYAESLSSSISGRVTDESGNGLQGIVVWAGFPYNALTGSEGQYTITGLPAGTYDVRPATGTYTFEPPVRSVTVPPIRVGKDFTGTLVLPDVDIGFRPYPYGYGFNNWRAYYPASPPLYDPDYSDGNLLRMFGEEAVCWRTIGSVCILREAAARWQWNANMWTNRGHCDGMAVTSLRFLKDLDEPADFQADAGSVHDLERGNVRHHIAYYFAAQLEDPVSAFKEEHRRYPPSAVLAQLHAAMVDGAPDPAVLFIYRPNADGTLGGHAITPWAIEDRGSGVFWVRVYDNNYHDDANRYVVIDIGRETWSYDAGSLGIYSGDDTTDYLGAAPVSLYAERVDCPWYEGSWGAAHATSAVTEHVWLTGDGHLLLTDSKGLRIGFVGTNYISEIPEAAQTIVNTGLGTALEPIYTIPVTDTYTILLDGQTLTKTEEAAVTQFGPGYAAWFEGMAIGPTTRDHLSVAANGRELAYRPSEAREVTLAFALDDETATRKLQIHGADIGAGQVITLTADVDLGRLVFDNSDAGSGSYDIDICQNNESGERCFLHSEVDISVTDTHHIAYGDWGGTGTMRLEIDHGSDGTLDQILELENEIRRVYLPVVLR